MRIRTRRVDGVTHVDLLLSHPMESGQRQDGQGKTIPARYLTSVTLTHNGKIAAQVNLSPLVSRNPVVSIAISGGEQGDELLVRWVDNNEQSGTRSAEIS